MKTMPLNMLFTGINAGKWQTKAATRKEGRKNGTPWQERRILTVIPKPSLLFHRVTGKQESLRKNIILNYPL